MKAIRLRVNHMTAPIGISPDCALLSWNCDGDIRQTAYQIRLETASDILWDSGKIVGAEMQLRLEVVLPYRTEFFWHIRLWNENDDPGDWTQTRFETGLDFDQVDVVWVEPERELLMSCEDSMNRIAQANYLRKQDEVANQPQNPMMPPKSPLPDYVPHQPASYLRKHFTHQKTGTERLYITAQGLYVAWLNGQRVGDMVLAPGSFSGDVHLGVQTYDVSELLVDGDNELRIALGDGWHRSVSGVDGERFIFGEKTAVWFRLESQGQLICQADADMEASQAGAIRQNDLQQGEIFDARRETITDWHPVITKANHLILLHQDTFLIREHERFAGKLITTPNGETVIDFGQNIAGYPELTVTAHEGQVIRLICGETLDENGNFTQENFQDRSRHKEGGTMQTIELICREGVNHYKPSFTIMGFQYAKVETDIDLTGAHFTAIAVYSDMETLTTFESSNRDLNQLVNNSLWSMKSNFCDVPTDCPTRERAAWTGDVGVFVETGLYLMDCVTVIEKWLRECQITQYPDGRMANISPRNSKGSLMTDMLCMSAGWGDSSILTPYAIYKRTGDLSVLRDCYPMMQKWYAFLEGRAQQTTEEQQDGPYAKYTVLNGMDYGEWCEPGVTPTEAMMNPRKTVGTAYLAYSGGLLAEIAEHLNKLEDAKRYREVSELAKKAYRYAFTIDGVITSERQADYVRAIAFGLVTGDEASQAATILNDMIVTNDYHLNTGFLSTPYVCQVLADYGYLETAYRLLLQDTAPSWLYAVKKGANTIWETWTGIDDSGKPSESLNHYSYGAICGWLFGGVCGIRYEDGQLTIAPNPHPLLTHATTTYQAPCGQVTSGWCYDEDKVTFSVTIPSNATAQLMLPNGEHYNLKTGRYIFCLSREDFS